MQVIKDKGNVVFIRVSALKKIDVLRDKLHKAIDNNNNYEILTISQELDIEIVKFMQNTYLSEHGLSRKRISSINHINKERSCKHG